MESDQRGQYLIIAMVVIGVVIVGIGLRTWKVQRDAELKKMHDIEISIPAGLQD